MSKVLIIGGGASGLIAGIIAAKNNSKVTIIDRMPKVGKKILATGNGRCNYTNKNITTSRYFSESNNIVESIFNEFSYENTIEFFNKLGIHVLEKEDGKLYPRSEQASSVLNALIYEAEKHNINLVCNEEVINITKAKNFKIETKDNVYYSNKLVIATGGKSCPDLGSNGSGYNLAKILGHSVIEPFPSLVQLKTDFKYLKQVKGTKVNGNIKLFDNNYSLVREEYGEILFTDYGVSGPPVLQISRNASKNILNNIKAYIEVDLAYEFSEQELDKELLNRANNNPNKTTSEFLIGFINGRMITPVLNYSNIDINKKVANLSKGERNTLASNIKKIKMEVTGTHQWNQSQVTAGGVNTNEVSDKTLESKLVKDLYLCGEVLDIDGDCGGFNLQWAWSSGAVVGKAISESKVQNHE